MATGEAAAPSCPGDAPADRTGWVVELDNVAHVLCRQSFRVQHPDLGPSAKCPRRKAFGSGIALARLRPGMLVTISRDAARALRVSMCLGRQYRAIAAAIQGGRLSNGRWGFNLTPHQAISLRVWCDGQADALRRSDTARAALFDGVAADLTAAMIANRP